MKSFHDESMELISMMKLYLLQEFSRDERLVTSNASYEFFRNFASTQMKPAQPQSKIEPQKAPIKKVEKRAPTPEVQKLQKPQPLPEAQPLPDVTKKVELTPLPSPSGLDLSDIKRKFTQVFPDHVVIDKIPEFEPIQRKPVEAIIIAFDEDPQHRTFLTNLTKAIDDSICSALLVEAAGLEKQDNQDYPHLRLIIATESTKWIQNREQKNCAFVLLSPISDYLASPKLKSQLWKQLKSYYSP